MQERIAAYGDAVQRTHGIPIQIRVGLNSGEVVLRAVGADPSALSAVGQTVHVASRMEQLAKPGTILVTGETAALSAGRVRTRSLGPAVNQFLPLLRTFRSAGQGFAEHSAGLHRLALLFEARNLSTRMRQPVIEFSE
jgi:class 3 adenylate cyclase